MSNNAASIAKELSGNKSKNRSVKEKVDTDVEEVGGGIAVEEKPVEGVAPAPLRTGTPFDLVKGRPMVDYWGPFEAYHFVTTQHGEYAIPFGQILRFEMVEEFDTKQQRQVIRPYPKYEDAPLELIEYVSEAAE